MRLYLSSFGIGNAPEKLIDLVGSNKRVAVILNAVDHKEGRNERFQKEVESLYTLGFRPEELDLRNYFGKSQSLENKLLDFGLVWVRGGNCFVLQRAFEMSGFNLIIKKLLAEDKIVYGGYSAGVCLATPSLKGTELVDDPNVVPAGYKNDFSWGALHLINYEVAVHYKSDHPESEDVDRWVKYLEENNMPYKTLKDGEVIIVHDGKEQIMRIKP